MGKISKLLEEQKRSEIIKQIKALDGLIDNAKKILKRNPDNSKALENKGNYIKQRSALRSKLENM